MQIGYIIGGIIVVCFLGYLYLSSTKKIQGVWESDKSKRVFSVSLSAIDPDKILLKEGTRSANGVHFSDTANPTVWSFDGQVISFDDGGTMTYGKINLFSNAVVFYKNYGLPTETTTGASWTRIG